MTDHRKFRNLPLALGQYKCYLSMRQLNQFIGIKMLTSYFLETFESQFKFPRA